uniref:DDE Tnp4 domain-containing protein n=1 Tax=Salarias fasciatus TaxID=181472 RepID=A0A672HPZ2_SALFA
MKLTTRPNIQDSKLDFYFHVITLHVLCLFQRALLSGAAQRRRPVVWSHIRTAQWWDEIVPSFSTEQWMQNFRLSEDTFNSLCHKMRPFMERQDTAFRLCVPLRKRLAIALWKLATGSEYRCIEHLFGVSKSVVCQCVQEFCGTAEKVLVPELVCVLDEDKFGELAVNFESRWGLPHCVGAIDSCHIPIIAPRDFQFDYLNSEGWHSIILQAVVDGKGQFWNVYAGQPGSMHDAKVLRLSPLWEQASQGTLFPDHTREIGGVSVGHYILGDSACPLQRWLLKPFHDTGRLTEEQHTFNNKLSHARVVVENAFRRLKGRWRCLSKRNHCDIRLVKSMVLTCCALHNLCETHGAVYEAAWDAPGAAAPEPTGGVLPDAEEAGNEVRDGLMRHLMNN